MRIKLIEHGTEGEDGEHYAWEADLDIATTDEAYVKGREFQALIYAMSRGLYDQAAEERPVGSESDDENS